MNAITNNYSCFVYAVHSISTLALAGNVLTAKVLRAGKYSIEGKTDA